MTRLHAVTEPAIVESDAADRLDWLSAGHWQKVPQAPERAPGFGLRLPILDRYIVTEMLGPFAFGFIAITLFMLINALFLAADFIIGKGIPVNLTLRWLVLQLPAYMYLIIPFAAMFGVLLGFGRLAGDNEITALRTSGVPLHRIAAPAYVTGIAMMIAAFTINEQLAPVSMRQADVLFRQIAYHSSAPIIAPNQIIKTSNGSQQYTLFVGSVDTATGTMHDVQISVMQAGYFPETWTAADAKQINGKIVLYDGIEAHYGKDGFVGAQQHFKEFDIPIGDTSALYGGSLTAFEMNSKDLRQQIAADKASGEDSRQDEMVLQQKFAMPAASMIAVLVALPLAVRFGKRGRGVGALITIAVMVVYYLIMAATNALGKNGAISTTLAAWIPNLAVGGAGLFLLLMEER